jgi:hypothetical protein
LVTGRGLSRDEVLTDVEALVDVDSVLRPSAGFNLAESAKALPPTTPSPATASAAYSYIDGPYVATNSVPIGRSSIETINWHEVGRLDLIGGREVMFTDGRQGNPPSVAWLDVASSGAVVAGP